MNKERVLVEARCSFLNSLIAHGFMQSESHDTTSNKILRFAPCLLLPAPVISILGSNSFSGPVTITPFRIVGSDHLISVASIYVDEVPLPLHPSLLEGGAKLILLNLLRLKQRYYITRLFVN